MGGCACHATMVAIGIKNVFRRCQDEEVEVLSGLVIPVFLAEGETAERGCNPLWGNVHRVAEGHQGRLMREDELQDAGKKAGRGSRRAYLGSLDAGKIEEARQQLIIRRDKRECAYGNFFGLGPFHS